MIPLFKPIVTPRMRQAALAALENEHFVLGESVFKFEEEFARHVGTKYAVSMSSGTAAIQTALRALGVGPGAEVLTPTFSFVATANAVTMTGARPRFADSQPTTGNIDPARLDMKSCGAILPVHLYGNPCELKAVRDAAERTNAPVVEDACQAHGAEYGGRKVGGWGDAGCFSFYSTKNLTVAGDGGMITTNREDVRDFATSYRDCGRVPGARYQHQMIGDTLRLNTLNAAIGRVQLRALSKWNEQRRRLARSYQRALPRDMQFQETPGAKGVYHIYAIRHPERDKIRAHLEKRSIQTGIHYPLPIHQQPAYEARSRESYPTAERLSREVLSIPLHPSMKRDDAQQVVEAIKEVVP